MRTVQLVADDKRRWIMTFTFESLTAVFEDSDRLTRGAVSFGECF